MQDHLSIISKKLRHAESLANTRVNDIRKRLSSDSPYETCFIRLGNKAKYAAEIVDFYTMCLQANHDLSSDQVERVIETEKWFFIGVLSVIEYSMPLFLGDRGSEKLRITARNGPFSIFLARAETEGVIDANERSLLDFSSRVRNDLIHRNGISRESISRSFHKISFELNKDEMMEGHWGMLSDLGTLAIYSVAAIIDGIETHLGE